MLQIVQEMLAVVCACAAYLLHKKEHLPIQNTSNNHSLSISNFTGSDISEVSTSEIVYKSKLVNLEVIDDINQAAVLDLISQFKIGAWV